MASEVTTILGTAVSVGGAIAGALVWAFRSVIAGEVTPTLVELRTEAAALAKEFASFREVKENERRETAAILHDLHKIVQDHEVRLAEHQLRLDALAAPKRRPAR